HQRGRGRRPRKRHGHAGARENEAQPEHQAAENREALAHGQPPMLAKAPRVAPPRGELIPPADQEQARRNQQPQVLRRRKPYSLEIDAWQFSTHNFQRFKTRRATFLGSPTAKASPSGVATTSHPQPPDPSPQLLPLADLLTTFSSVRCVLSLFSAFGDDDLELVHVRGRRRAAGLPVQRRAGRKILLV